jgi:hypothetical protein
LIVGVVSADDVPAVATPPSPAWQPAIARIAIVYSGYRSPQLAMRMFPPFPTTAVFADVQRIEVAV